ncbi:HAMP domain-containing protein [Ectothiorhodospiraceae bacterium WFHF3C12]|nr:HAMP domain-containing protein [Ectothiorhodospiraceae bacterium WFHF3C12]
MARGILRRIGREGPLRLALSALLLLSLVLLTLATENSAAFGQLYVWLLLFNGLGIALLVALIGANLWRLARQRSKGQVGSRLTVRLVLIFALLAVVPGTVVYLFSMQFLRSGIDSWYDVQVQEALDDALTLSQASLDMRMRDLLKRVQASSEELMDTPDGLAALTLSDMRARLEAAELTLLGSNGRIIATSSRDTSAILPHRPEEEILLQLRQGRSYVGLDPIDNSGLHIRAVVPAPSPDSPGSSRVLQALFPVSPRINDLAETVQQAYGEYRELSYLREPLKDSFVLTLSLVLLLSLLFAVWTAFYLARRLVSPVSGLAEATRAVAEGDYGTQLPPAGNDELGFLVRSFNDMSRRIAQARDAAKRGQVQVEGQRAYLEAVLSRLSSGVLALDVEGRLRTSNQAAVNILSVPLYAASGQTLDEITGTYPELAPMTERLADHVAAGDLEWREELTLDTAEGRRSLMCSGAALPGGHGTGGHVIVFDDVTALIQAQRDAAWGEVARRLAHEIRNPLTPIQLSAERIRKKYLDDLDPAEAEVLERCTRTIIQQVDTMKAMVQAFSAYARPPHLVMAAVDVNELVTEVVELFRGAEERPSFVLDLQPDLPALNCDAGRMRQLLNNLVRNALEAGRTVGRYRVTISTRETDGPGGRMVEVQVRDDGPGFADEVLDQLFEPYVTTKPKGTGLGLPIVKKIVEEHSGRISARNAEQGALVTVTLPIGAAQAAGPNVARLEDYR